MIALASILAALILAIAALTRKPHTRVTVIPPEQVDHLLADRAARLRLASDTEGNLTID